MSFNMYGISHRFEEVVLYEANTEENIILNSLSQDRVRALAVSGKVGTLYFSAIEPIGLTN